MSNLTLLCHSECNEESVRVGIKTISESWTDPSVSPQDDKKESQGNSSLWIRLLRRFTPRNDNSRKGFTLAEVLLVITIIGIVASYTIPDLINNIIDQQHKTALKKTYSVLSQVTIFVSENNGGSLAGLPQMGDTDPSLINYYYPYLSIIKKCTFNNTRGNCWHANGVASWMNGTPATNANWEYIGKGVILADGALVEFYDISTDCTNVGMTGGVCSYASIDVNGFKGPNIYGKDIFRFFVTKTGFIPRGAQGDLDSVAGDCIPTGRGDTCAMKELTNN